LAKADTYPWAQGAHSGLQISGPWPDDEEDALEEFRKVYEEKELKNASEWLHYGNLLLKSGKLFLADLAYERAISIDPKNAPSLNNKAILMINTDKMENWIIASRAKSLFDNAIKSNPFFVVSKINLGLLMNYYRLFANSKSLFEQALVAKNSKSKTGIDNDNNEKAFLYAYDGLGMSHQGVGKYADARKYFEQANSLGKGRFAWLYHNAVMALKNDKQDDCTSILDDIEEPSEFEKDAAKRLGEVCKK